MKPVIKLHRGMRYGVEMIFLEFEMQEDLLFRVARIPYIEHLLATDNVWAIPASRFELNVFFTRLNPVAFIDYSRLKSRSADDSAEEEFKPVKARISEGPAGSFRRWLEQRRYSASTVKTYVHALQVFLGYFADRELKTLNNDDVREFMYERIVREELSFSYQNQVVNALRLFFREILKSEIDPYKLERPRTEHKLPNVLSKGEVKNILESLRNTKHRCMLSLIYACGLRRGELLKLKLQDVDSDRNLLIIRQSKGRKDRVIPMTPKIIEMMREYYRQYRPEEWLFEGQNAGTPYSERSIQLVLHKAVEQCGISKPVTLHWLRHSYATHLLESGVSLRYIQELLGHKSSRTTEIYTHVSQHSLQKIRSPFDDL